MAGYSGTPLARKLGIKVGHHVALVHAPPGFESVLEELPLDVTLTRDLASHSPFDVIVCFVEELRQLRSAFPGCVKRLASAGGLWVGWPKKASGVATDLTENVVRVVGLDAGLVDNKVCAIDETWSGLRFVIRVQDRPRQKGASRGA
jgi:hypothetical protein